MIAAAKDSTAVRGLALCACSLVVLSLAACQPRAERRVKGWMVADPTANHPIVVDRKETVMDLSVPPGSYGLTHNQKHDLRGFAYRFKSEDSGGVLVVRSPSGGANEIAAMRAMDDVRRVLRSAGVPPADSVFEAYSSAGVPSAPIRVSYMRHIAQPPACGDWSENLARDPGNRSYPNLGCATQRNLAAMVANPRDLVEPRGMTPRSSERRDVIWDKYIKGEATIAEKADEEKAKVSDVEGGDQ